MADAKGARKVKLVKPKTKRGARALKAREPQLVEEEKKTLLFYGNKPSQVVKDVIGDLNKLEKRRTVKYTRKNGDILPFDAGGEVQLERFSRKTDCGQFVMGNHTKKRPHNLILGRFFDHRLYDLLELGVENFKALTAFGAAAAHVQADNKPCFVFRGEQFAHDADFRHARSMLLDLFRGQVVGGLDLLGIDHVICCTAHERSILFRQYAVRLKKSGTKIPRVELQEMGPAMDLTLRRRREADAEVQAQAFKQPRLAKKKEKNVSSSLLDGRVGRIYMPKQQIDSVPQQKMKGLKRERKAAVAGAGDVAKPKRQKAAAVPAAEAS